jgi:hypothetical protein
MRGSFEGTLNAQRVKMVDADGIRETAEKLVREAAGRGICLVVGRGSAYYLQPRPDASHVFVYMRRLKNNSAGCVAWLRTRKRPAHWSRRSTGTGPRTSGTTSKSSRRPAKFTIT